MLIFNPTSIIIVRVTKTMQHKILLDLITKARLGQMLMVPQGVISFAVWVNNAWHKMGACWRYFHSSLTYKQASFVIIDEVVRCS